MKQGHIFKKTLIILMTAQAGMAFADISLNKKITECKPDFIAVGSYFDRGSQRLIPMTYYSDESGKTWTYFLPHEPHLPLGR